jgi:hypothetical protein
VIKFVLRQVGDFSLVSSTNKTDRHDITEMLLKVALSTNKPIIKCIIINKPKVILPHALVIIADFGYPV